MLHMCVWCILALSRTAQFGSWKTDPSFLRWFYHTSAHGFGFSGMRLSNIDLTLLAISTLGLNVLGNEAFIATSGYIGSTSLKTSHPHGLPL
jgi:hypothetical protein